MTDLDTNLDGIDDFLFPTDPDDMDMGTADPMMGFDDDALNQPGGSGGLSMPFQALVQRNSTELPRTVLPEVPQSFSLGASFHGIATRNYGSRRNPAAAQTYGAPNTAPVGGSEASVVREEGTDELGGALVPQAAEDDNRYVEKRKRATGWPTADHQRFYRALQQFGTDFSLISAVFPGRSRDDIRRKFKLEERRHPDQVHAALANAVPIDEDEFKEGVAEWQRLAEAGQAMNDEEQQIYRELASTPHMRAMRTPGHGAHSRPTSAAASTRLGPLATPNAPAGDAGGITLDDDDEIDLGAPLETLNLPAPEVELSGPTPVLATAAAPVAEDPDELPLALRFGDVLNRSDKRAANKKATKAKSGSSPMSKAMKPPGQLSAPGALASLPPSAAVAASTMMPQEPIGGDPMFGDDFDLGEGGVIGDVTDDQPEAKRSRQEEPPSMPDSKSSAKAKAPKGKKRATIAETPATEVPAASSVEVVAQPQPGLRAADGAVDAFDGEDFLHDGDFGDDFGGNNDFDMDD